MIRETLDHVSHGNHPPPPSPPSPKLLHRKKHNPHPRIVVSQLYPRKSSSNSSSPSTCPDPASSTLRTFTPGYATASCSGPTTLPISRPSPGSHGAQRMVMTSGSPGNGTGGRLRKVSGPPPPPSLSRSSHI